MYPLLVSIVLPMFVPQHYSGIMRFIANGPYLVDCNMNRPQNNRKHYMDSLLAFWPGLQVLWGDIESAASTHDLLYFVNHKHHFLPEAFNLDMRGVVWANHPLRPEFAESTYFLYKATGDPYYLDIGKSIIESLNRYARVPCGFAAVKDVRTKSHEDRSVASHVAACIHVCMHVWKEYVLTYVHRYVGIIVLRNVHMYIRTYVHVLCIQ